jgi:hypothetical protein
LSVFVLVGFVFLLSALFFWSFKSSTHTPGWSAAHQLPMIPCVLMGLCLTPRIPCSTVKTLDFTSSIPAVVCASFLRFRVLVLCPLGAAVSTVALDLPTKSISICFPSVTVSVSWREVRGMFVCVLCVLMISLMTKGGSAPSDGNGGEWSGNPPSIFTGVPPRDDGNGVEIRRLYLPFTLRRSILTAGAPGSTFFFAIVLSSQ